jgi:ribonuclease Z
VIDVLLLGTGAMVPLPGRPLSSLLVRAGKSLVLFDCGEGTQVEMRRHHWGFRALDAICLSHLHADHVAGLPGLFHTVANAGRTEPMHLYGPAGTAEVIRGLRVIAQHLPFDMVIHEVGDGAAFPLPEGMEVTVAEAAHRVACVAYRVDVARSRAFDPAKAEALGLPRTLWSRLQKGEAVTLDGAVIGPDAVLGEPRKGVAFAFMTDTRPTPGLVRLANGVDLLVCEATYAEDADAEKANLWGHLTLRQACGIAAEAGAGALWTTHFGGGIEDPVALESTARAMFGPTTMGRPGLQGKISFGRGFEGIDAGSARG